MQIVVTGGAGYIGSHMVRTLRSGGHDVLVVDDLSTGHRDMVPRDVELLVADIADSRVGPALRRHRTEAIFHFASRIQVAQSVIDPRLYYTSNLAASIALLERALDAGVGYFILSSTAAVYGNPVRVPIDESHPTEPVNPYGETKLALERMLGAYCKAYPMRFAALRYFNAAGADADAGLGERHEPETHLLPLVLEAALGRRDGITVFGTDYDTPDGTCIRDYVHVLDLCDAHPAALRYLVDGGESGPFNVGTGEGHSVRTVIEAAERVSGRRVPVQFGPRRPGDPSRLVASVDRAATVLGWRARLRTLDRIVYDAWRFHSGLLADRAAVAE
jgi:UDP-glucose 4-epimerase